MTTKPSIDWLRQFWRQNTAKTKVFYAPSERYDFVETGKPTFFDLSYICRPADIRMWFRDNVINATSQVLGQRLGINESDN